MFFSKKPPPAPPPFPPAVPYPAVVERPAPLTAPPPAAAIAPPIGATPHVVVPSRAFAPPGTWRLQRQAKRLRQQLRSQTRARIKQRCWSGPRAFGLPNETLDIEPSAATVEAMAGEPYLSTAAPAQLSPIEEIQGEVLDLPQQQAALGTDAALNAPAVAAPMAKAPAFPEVRYEIAELHHQVQELQKTVASLKAAIGATEAGISASQLSIVDDKGRTVASISSAGVLSCSAVVLRANL